MVENKAFKIAGIRNLIERNYGVPSDLLSLDDLIDDSIGMAENWNEIKPKVLELCGKPNKLLYYRG